MGNLAHELSGEVDGIDLGSIMSGGETPETQTPETPAATPAPVKESAPTTLQEIEFIANQKPIKVPMTDPRVKQWLSQGYSYAQSMQQFNTDKTQWEQKVQNADQLAAKYKEIEDYQKKDPAWWNHVTQSYQQKMGTAVDPNNPLAKEIQTLRKELEDIKGFRTEITNEKQQKQRESEDTALSAQIKSIRDNYSNLDWTTPDASGKSLELQVLEFAAQNGIPKFDLAFKAFKHDTLLKLAEERGKSAVVKDVQAKTKLGLLGKTSTPTKGLQDAKNHKTKSYSQLMAEGLSELTG